MQATLAALADVADLGWFERVLRPFPVLDHRNVVEDVIFDRTPIVAGYREALPAFTEGFSAAHSLMSSVW
ncbi:MAG: hypothetical protein EXR52_00435 [Dehalococcoidia bacterium]|nr:hypothetical protein [Dehalococcoidia bacterium]